MLEAGFDEPHGKALGRMWAAEAAAFVGKLKARPLGAPTLLDVDYHLNLMMGESSLTRLQEPTALFELTISNPNSASKDGGAKVASEKLAIEFSHPELFSLFTQLERVQAQLDGLSAP